jgi:hypothetical protein
LLYEGWRLATFRKQSLSCSFLLLRKSKGPLLGDIMIEAGCYDAQWRKYEAGGSLNITSLMKIALALEVTLTELLDGLGQWRKLSVAEIQAAVILHRTLK